MDRIINWLILIIIFVFDPSTSSILEVINNALQVDRGIVDKQKVIRKRELYDEEPEEEEELTELQKTLLMDVEDEEEVLSDEVKRIRTTKRTNYF